MRLADVHSTTNETRNFVQRLDQSHRDDSLTHWLNPTDPSTNFATARDLRHKHTGNWYLRSNVYLDWISQSKSFLWLRGVPGCGKTVLSSAVIEDLKERNDTMPLYFFFDSNDVRKQSHDGMLRSLIDQLYSAQPETKKPLDSLFASCLNGKDQPTVNALGNVFLEMLHGANNVWIVLDALDECTERNDQRNSRGILPFIKQIAISELQSVHLLITSRVEEGIQAALTGWISPENITTIEGELVADDIDQYVHSRVHEDSDLSRWHSHGDIQDEIKKTVTGKADGMSVPFLPLSRLVLFLSSF